MKNDRNAREDKQKWIDAAVNSIQNMQPAVPPANLFLRITNEINSPKNKVIPFFLKPWAAAALLLLALNIGSIVYFWEHNNKKAGITNYSITAEMQLETAYNY